VELKNLDAWKAEGADEAVSEAQPNSTDETWSQFQKVDLQNKLRVCM